MVDSLLQEPLAEAELDELEQFLMSDAVPPECMDLVMLDGFLTAVAIGPAMILPSEWLPEVWGDPEGPEFQSQEDAERIMGLMMRRLNEIILTLRDAPFAYEPLLYELEYDQLDVNPWCLGFLGGMALHSREWEPLMRDQASEVLLAPVMLLGTEIGMEEIKKSDHPKAEYDKWQQMIGSSVVALYAFWSGHREKRPSGMTADSFPFGGTRLPARNAPCPCGSGKKYKKCCGVMQRPN